MKNCREQLAKLYNYNLKVLVCAESLDYFIDKQGVTVSDEDFDTLTSFVYDWWTTALNPIRIDDLSKAVVKGLALKEISMEDYYADYRTWVEYINKELDS